MVGSAEVIEKEMTRPYFVGKGSAVVGQMAAALAVGSIVLKMIHTSDMRRSISNLQMQQEVTALILLQMVSTVPTADSGMSCCGLPLGSILQQVIEIILIKLSPIFQIKPSESDHRYRISVGTLLG